MYFENDFEDVLRHVGIEPPHCIRNFCCANFVAHKSRVQLLSRESWWISLLLHSSPSPLILSNPILRGWYVVSLGNIFSFSPFGCGKALLGGITATIWSIFGMSSLVNQATHTSAGNLKETRRRFWQTPLKMVKSGKNFIDHSWNLVVLDGWLLLFLRCEWNDGLDVIYPFEFKCKKKKSFAIILGLNIVSSSILPILRNIWFLRQFPSTIDIHRHTNEEEPKISLTIPKICCLVEDVSPSCRISWFLSLFLSFFLSLLSLHSDKIIQS